METATSALAKFAVDTEFDDLPAELVADIKLVVLDLIGCAIAGASVEKGAIAIRLVQRMGGEPDSMVLGTASRVPPASAAFANGELMNALDWDPIPHTLPCVVAACLAMAECEGASGKDLILGIALGYEIASRLADVLPGDLEPHPHGYGSCTLGAVAGVGRILKLDRRQMANSLGIAGFAAPIPAMTRFEGGISPIPMTKYISIGWVAQAAVMSALMAQAGYTGDAEILDGPEGFWRLFGGTPERWDPARLTQGLGEQWNARRAWYKPYPCEVLIGVAINRLIEIMRENCLSPDDIEDVDFRSLPILSTPCHTTMEIVTHVDAQFSVPYALAVAALGIEPGPAWQDERTIRDPAVMHFMRKVRVGVHEVEIDTPGSAKQASSVGQIPCHLVVTAHGRKLTIDRTESFMTEQEILAKFERNALSRVPSVKVENGKRMMLDLETVENVAAAMSSFAP
jgi:2-methylcitrate dehydratase PrpD